VSEPRILRVAELVRLPEAIARAAVQDRAARLGATVISADLGDNCLLTLELRRRWWDRLPRVLVIGRLDAALGLARSRQRRLIVAAAIVRDHRVLAAQRAAPPALAGQWEFPGGKAEAGESARSALEREIHEELGVRVTVQQEWARHELPDGAELVLFGCALAEAAAVPRAVEHQQLRWVGAGEIPQIGWLATNQRFSTVVMSRISR
jgi:8-oxo-dGTP diphosphatase